MAFYYHDSRENRWIKSIQSAESTSLNLTPIPKRGGRFVFRWVEDRYLSNLF